jgi:copper homeostasis protein
MTAGRRVVLEVGVTGVEEALRAESSGADRQELCSGLEVGGLTPSPGTFLAVREAVRLPVYVLLRPRTGGFTCSDAQFETMKRDAEWFLRNGANGIVFGILHCHAGVNVIDRNRCEELVRLAGGRAVFHRAFDFLPEPLVRLEELADLGFERVQTSGGSPTAEGGAGRLSAWIAHAGWQIEIMPAGGITPAVVGQLLRETQAGQVHASLRAPVPDPSLLTNPRLGRAMGVADPEVGWPTTDANFVQAMRNELDRFVRAGDESDG